MEGAEKAGHCPQVVKTDEQRGGLLTDALLLVHVYEHLILVGGIVWGGGATLLEELHHLRWIWGIYSLVLLQIFSLSAFCL